MIRRTITLPLAKFAAWAIALAMTAACNETAKPTADLTKPNAPVLAAHNSSTSPSENYLGQDWAQRADARAAQTPRAGSPPPSNPRAPSAKSNPSAQPSAIWTLVLNTFSDVGHEEAARQMLANLPRVAPQVTGARVHTSSKGSMVIYGNYTGRDDRNAAADQERLKAIMHNGRPVFNRIILTRIDLRMTQGQVHPHDLIAARRANPKVVPLYTLDVAIWLSNPDDSSKERMTFEEVRRRAEAYAAQLRAQKQEAYFYHDDVNQWSTVTVGLFDRRAIHPGSGLYSSEVEDVLRKFPARLVNGEPLMEKTNRLKKDSPTRPQRPKLVEVPTF